MSRKTDNEAATDRFMNFLNSVYANAPPITDDDILHSRLSRNAAAVLCGAEPWRLPSLTAEEQSFLFAMVSRKTVAELVGVTPSRISQLVTDDVLHPVDGRFLLWQVVTEYAEHIRSRGER